jgi:hypothetical protein
MNPRPLYEALHVTPRETVGFVLWFTGIAVVAVLGLFFDLPFQFLKLLKKERF